MCPDSCAAPRQHGLNRSTALSKVLILLLVTILTSSQGCRLKARIQEVKVRVPNEKLTYLCMVFLLQNVLLVFFYPMVSGNILYIFKINYTSFKSQRS